jgi:sigma-B regulation protein RsbU (phosphoserine phosphatase)
MTPEAAYHQSAISVAEKPDHDKIRNARILVADDDPICRRLVAGILRGQHFTNLRFAEGGISALEQVRSFRPDLLLLEMQMPDMSGLEVCRQVRADPEFADVPILVQTATVDRKKMGELFSGGVSDFLSMSVEDQLPAQLSVACAERVC